MVMATKPVDFRRGHDGLVATVECELGLDPHSGLTVISRSKRGDRDAAFNLCAVGCPTTTSRDQASGCCQCG